MTRRARRPLPTRRRALLATVLATSIGAGCASTTINTAATTLPGGAPPTSVFTARGSRAELLDEWQVELAVLSARLVDNEGGTPALARIELLWDTVRPEIEAGHPDLTPGFEAVMGLTRTAVERRRPADADKASKQLRDLIEAIGG